MKTPTLLSKHAMRELDSLILSPRVCATINPGVVNKLITEGLAEAILLPSPYKTGEGKTISHLQITAAGRKRLEQAS